MRLLLQNVKGFTFFGHTVESKELQNKLPSIEIDCVTIPANPYTNAAMHNLDLQSMASHVHDPYVCMQTVKVKGQLVQKTE